jgi:hypothetical protein
VSVRLVPVHSKFADFKVRTRAKTLLLLKNNIKTSKTLKKFTKESVFVKKTAFLSRFVKQTGYSYLEWGWLFNPE